MNIAYSTNHKFKRVLTNILSIFVILAMASPVTTVAYAATKSPFLGQWQATDVDGSDMSLIIAGRAEGPFQITWTDNNISLCNGEPGIVHGTGWLNEGDSNLLETDVHLECFTTGSTLDFHVTFRYHPATNTLSVRWSFGQVTIWYRSGRPLPPPPTLNLRVNYGHDWVESFYEGGHTAWVTVTDADGNVMATSELVTEPKDYWGGETGFQSLDSAWFDADGNQMENPPDVQPNDWVFGWVDNGASAQVQIGEINGTIDLAADSIEGTIYAPGFSDPVQVECLDWGSGGEPFSNKDGGSILTNGSDSYSCSWTGEWDIQPGQTVGVGYFGSDGNWVANAFTTPNLHFSVFPEWEYVEGWEWPDGALVTAVVEGKPECSIEGNSGHPDWDPNELFVPLWFPEACNVVVGDVVTLTDGVTPRTHTVQNLAITAVDRDSNTITGTADAGAMVHVWPHGYNELLPTTGEDGNWLADFNSIGIDLVEGMAGRTEIRDEVGNATAVEWRIPSPHFSVFPDWKYVEGYEWPDQVTMTATINGKPECSAQGTVGYPEWDRWNTLVSMNFPQECHIEVGNVVTLTDGATTRTHTVRNLAITAVDKAANTVSGTADAGAQVHVWAHGYNELVTTTGEDGTWLADFDSIGIDLLEGMCGRAEIRDEMGNATAAPDWCIPSPRLIAFPAVEEIFGYNWPEGSEVHLSINTDGFSQTATVGPSSWDPNDILAYFHFKGQYDLKPGDVVTLSGSGMERTYTVRNLTVTEVNEVANTVSGTADPGTEVTVYPFEFGNQPLHVTADENGNWFANFDAVGIDLIPGMCGRSDIFDEFTNSTTVDWCIPRPWLNAFPEWDIIYSYEWPANSEVNLTINGQFVQTVTVGPTSWDPNVYTAYFEFGELYDMKPGDVVTLSGSGMQLTYTVQNLTVTAVDEIEDTVSGAADANAEIVVFPLATWQQLWVTADENGNWRVDFTGTFDLVPGECGRAEIRDGLGSSTAVDWCIPEPPPTSRTLEAGKLYVEWSDTNPEEVTYLSWKGSNNLVNTGSNPYCSGDLEYFGNSWVSENEGTPDFFFASLVGWGTTGTWTGQTNTQVNIDSISSGCPGSADIPIHTQYQFIDGKPDLIMIQRTFEFGEEPYAHNVRPFIPRLYPWNGFTQVPHPNATSDALVTETSSTICAFGCIAESWDGSWFAIHNPVTGQGMIVQSLTDPIALWLDNDAASFTNSSSILLLQPAGGFTGTVTETEYLCFYDSNTWTPSLTLPDGCQP